MIENMRPDNVGAANGILAPRLPMLERVAIWGVAIGRRLAFAGVIGMLIIIVLTMADIFLRWRGVGSVPGLNEILAWGVAVAVAAMFPAGAAERFNLAVDVLAGWLGRRSTRRLHFVGAFILLLFYVALTWCLAKTAAEMSGRGAVTMFLHWPEAPFVWAIDALLAFSSLAQAIACLIASRTMLSRADESITASGDRSRVWRPRPIAVGIVVLLLTVGVIATGAGDEVSAMAKASPILTGTVLTIVMMAAVLLMTPIAAAMGAVGLIGAVLLMGFNPAILVLGTSAVEYLANPEMAVLPFFLIMGAFAGFAGLSDDIYRLAHVLLGHRRGGLALATVGGCAGFGALSSSSIATCAAIGQVVMPEMRKRGYAPALSTGAVAAGGTLAPLLSPGSGPLVIYALLTEQSIGQLFIGSAIPAALAIVLFGITVMIMVRVRPSIAPERSPPASWSDTGRAIAKSWGVILLIALVFGGIYGGVFTVTEAAAVGAGISFLFALFRGKLSRGALWQVMSQVTATTAMLYIMFFGAVMFSYFVDYSGAPEYLTVFLKGLPFPPPVVIALFLVVFVLLGCIMESFAVMLIVVPIVAPYIHQMGFNEIWWGVVMVGVVETGLITPPLGLNVLVLKNIAGNDIATGTIFRGVMPFIGADLVRLALLVLFPALVTSLPGLLR